MPIHPTAIVDPSAELDGSVTVGPYCIVEGHVRIEAKCRLYHNVYVTGWTKIGPDCELHPGVVVGHSPQDTKYKGERSYCRIGRGTILREYVTIHRGTVPESATVIGEECFFLGGSHVGHNCTVGNRVTLINNALLAGHVEIGDTATVGGAAGIHQFVRIGELAMIAGAGRIRLDIVPFALTDAEGHIAGLNRVGLRRAGLPRDHVEDIRKAFRCLFSTAAPFENRMEQLAGSVRTPPGRRLLEFVRSTGKRGLAGRSRRTRRGFEENTD